MHWKHAQEKDPQMYNKKLKVLLIIEQCNPEWTSVPLVGYKFFSEIHKLVDATMVTHERNKTALKKRTEYDNIIFTSESSWNKTYYRFISKLTNRGGTNWPLLHTLSYPIYADFNRQVYKLFKNRILKNDYDVVHAITPMVPRYPIKAIKACKHTPFLLGPVNGGIPFPPAFQDKARAEFAQFNFLKILGLLLIPGYKQTYRNADKILAGSTFTLNMLKKLFSIEDDRIMLFYENGIDSNFLRKNKRTNDGNRKINLLFVGRLVPCKCADILIEAVHLLEKPIQEKIQLTIVGDGSEKNDLENKVRDLQLSNIVSFSGWIRHKETLEYYRHSDIFCFPSVKEFGGAVVLEAMACGLPCIVVDYGGIGEYVTTDTGFKINPSSRNHLMQDLSYKIKILIEDEKLRRGMAENSIKRAKEFTWQQKAKKLVEIYKLMIDKKCGLTNNP